MPKTKGAAASSEASSRDRPSPPLARRTKRGLVLTLGAALVGAGGAAAYLSARPPSMIPYAPPEIVGLGSDLGDFVRLKLAAARERPTDVAAQVDYALALYFNNQFRGALPNFQSLRRLLPDDPKPVHYEAHCFREFGDRAKADAAYSESIRRFPAFAPSHYERGRLALESGDLDAAERDFARARELAPEKFDPRLGLGEVLLRRRDFTGAREHLEAAVRIDPGHKASVYQLGLALRGLGLRAEAERRLLEGSGSLPRRMLDAWGERQYEFSRSASDLTATALQSIKAGRASDGIRILERLHQAEPDNIEVLNNLSGAYQDAKQYSKAKDLLEDALARDPTRDATLANLASLHINMGEPAKALEYTDRALKLAPTFANAHFNRGNALSRLKRGAEALAAYREAVRHDPKNGRIRFAYARALSTQGEPAQARQEADRGVLLEPDFVPGRVLLIELHERIGDVDAARAAYLVASQRFPGHPDLAGFAKRYR
jgi:tetratricopeptide (TPR) repeat protein